jgi:protein-tyrosine phosphatase
MIHKGLKLTGRRCSRWLKQGHHIETNTSRTNNSRLPDPKRLLASFDLPHTWRYLRAQWRRGFGLNVSKVDDLLFVGGQFRARQWPALHALGIRAVLSLQAEHEDVFHGKPPERALRLHVPDFYPPSSEQLHEAVAFIQAARADQLPVLVHCHAGVGRAALTAGAFLIAGGKSHAEAFAHLRRARPIVALNAIQQARLAEWERLHQSSELRIENWELRIENWEWRAGSFSIFHFQFRLTVSSCQSRSPIV